MAAVRSDRSSPAVAAEGHRGPDDVLAADWHEVLNRFHRTTCALDRALGAQHNLSVSDFEVLQQLSAQDGAVRMHDLGEQVHLTQSALSRLITRLERAALVTRGICDEDRRAAWVKLTPAGEERFRAARPTHRAILRQQAGFDLTPDHP